MSGRAILITTATVAIIVSIACYVFLRAGASPLPHLVVSQAANNCGLSGTPAFCETFNGPAGGNLRDPNLPVYWGVSRGFGGVNYGG